MCKRNNDKLHIYDYVIIFIVMWLFVGWFSLVSIRSSNRLHANMIHLTIGYTYDKYTHIIYKESGLFNTTYSEYIDDNGNLNWYMPETSRWIPIEPQ